jgi:hypothetical protein
VRRGSPVRRWTGNPKVPTIEKDAVLETAEDEGPDGKSKKMPPKQ